MFTPHLDTHALGKTVWDSDRNRTSTSTTSIPQQLPTQPQSSDSLRPFAPIKISTRSSNRQESTVSLLTSSSLPLPSAPSSSAILAFKESAEDLTKTDARQLRASESTDATIYAGMNTLLNQVHASRFGIPDELPPIGHKRTLSSQNGSIAPISRQHSQDPSRAFAAWQQQQQQQQHTRITAATAAWSQQPGGASTNTVWYQQQQRNAVSTAQMIDEDDEMADVDDTPSFSASFSANGYRTPQGTGSSLATQQGYVLNQHLSHQQQQQQHHQHQQPLQQQQAGQSAEEEHNLYHTINSQLRAAFLARSEMDKRYR